MIMNSNFVSSGLSGLAGINQINLRENLLTMLRRETQKGSKDLSLAEITGTLEWIQTHGAANTSALYQFALKYGLAAADVKAALVAKFPGVFAQYFKKYRHAKPTPVSQPKPAPQPQPGPSNGGNTGKQTTVPAKAKSGANWLLIGGLALAAGGGWWWMNNDKPKKS